MVSARPAEVTADDRSVRFAVDGTVVGEYVLDDPYKPYFHPLRTLGGRVATLAMPFDHRHHKGLWYALTATDVNWWEEQPVEGYVTVVGVQSAESTETDTGVLRQRLRWTAEDGSLPTFLEHRVISCEASEDGVRWTWTAEFEVLRDVRLRYSLWAHRDEDRVTNYHGLGLRLPREFGWDPSRGQYPTTCEWLADGVLTTAPDLMGARPRSLTVTDYVDGEWPAPRVSVRITQPDTDHAVFTFEHPFAYVGIGPTAATELDLTAGSRFREHYLIDVLDA